MTDFEMGFMEGMNMIEYYLQHTDISRDALLGIVLMKREELKKNSDARS